MLGLQNADDWPVFTRLILPELRRNGSQVTMTEAFRFNVIEIETIDGSLRQAGDGWFDVEMGITVNDRTVRLEPLLADLFRRDPRWLPGGHDTIADDEAVELKTDRNERLADVLMARFDVDANTGKSRANTPYFLDVQSDFPAGLTTRVMRGPRLRVPASLAPPVARRAPQGPGPTA